MPNPSKIARMYRLRKLAEVDPDSTMVAIYPPQGWIDALKPYAHSSQADTLHCTLVYLGKLSSQDAKKALTLLKGTLKTQKPFPVVLNGSACFCNNDVRVRVVMPNGVELPGVRQVIYDTLEKADLLCPQNHGFIPHITLEYHDQGMPSNWEEVGALDLPPWTVDSIRVVRGNVLVGEIKL